MRELISTPLFGVFISLFAFEAGVVICRRFKLTLLNPLLVAVVLIMSGLCLAGIDYADYSKGGAYISFFLGPATLILAVPLYNKIELLKKDFIPVMAGVTAGCTAGIISIIIMSKLFGLDETVIRSIIPKSITVPIGIEISKQLGGITAITIMSIVLTGIFGNIFAQKMVKIFKIKDKVAIGVGIGTSGHAVGTSKAIEMGETEGAFGGLAIGIAGIVTVVIAPILVRIFLI